MHLFTDLFPLDKCVTAQNQDAMLRYKSTQTNLFLSSFRGNTDLGKPGIMFKMNYCWYGSIIL